MAVVVAGSRGRGEQQRLPWREGQQEARSPDMAPPRPPRPRSGPARAAVVYYLSRNGHLEHPHFMEVALASPDGLCLRDVIDRLDALRGKGMARMYAWASKRSYRNGFVWHDLADDDYIYPVAGREYVLKGTERLHAIQLPLLDAAAASSCSSGSQETATSSPPGALASPVMPRTAHYRARPPRHPTLASTTEIPAYRQKIVEDKEYFSGSLVETKRSSPANTSQDLAVLRRSSSYNADSISVSLHGRAQKVEPTTEAVGMHDRCIPRRSRGKKADGGYLVISGNAQYGGKKVGG
uniref:SOSEKI DIX-like domain-containing protein n=1 Tax=Oryza brachyantha TaxID=4533 RepID=J3L5N2_ORYBR